MICTALNVFNIMCLYMSIALNVQLFRHVLTCQECSVRFIMKNTRILCSLIWRQHILESMDIPQRTTPRPVLEMTMHVQHYAYCIVWRSVGSYEQNWNKSLFKDYGWRGLCATIILQQCVIVIYCDFFITQK